MPNQDYQQAQIEQLRAACDNAKLSSKDISFGSSLCDQFYTKSYLSDKQWYWVGELLKRAGDTPVAAPEKKTEEVFNGNKIRALLVKASETLKFPRLRYSQDGGGQIVFSYAADRANKWYGTTFINNGKKFPSKVNYGFIDSNGNGNLNLHAEQAIKTAIRKIAEDPITAAKLSGQKYSHCCFCGLELTNKSSIHHGYGPICADNWGLPWGDTGDPKDEEEAAKAELKHIQLQDI